MALTIDPITRVINVPQSYLTLISGTLYELDTDQFRLDLKVIEASEGGIIFEKTHDHNTEVTVAGTTFARSVKILLPYSVEFEDGQYTIVLQGSNNNIFDVANSILLQNQVQIISTNSAGLITVVSGSGVTDQDKTDIINGVWNNIVESGLTSEEILKLLLSVAVGKTSIVDLGSGLATVRFRDTADVRDRVTAAISGSVRTIITLDVV